MGLNFSLSEIDSEYLNLVKGELLLVRSAPLDEGSSQKWAFGWSVQGQRYGWFPLVCLLVASNTGCAVLSGADVTSSV